MLKRPTAMDILLFIGVIAGIGVGCYVLFRPLWEESAAQEGAMKFVAVVREARAYARSNHRVVQIAVRPATKSAASTYNVRDAYATVDSKEIERGVSATGGLRIDGDGSPMGPGTFIFRKGTHSVRMLVNDKGDISFPR